MKEAKIYDSNIFEYTDAGVVICYSLSNIMLSHLKLEETWIIKAISLEL